MFDGLTRKTSLDPLAEARARRKESIRSRRRDYIRHGITYEYWCKLVDLGVMRAYLQQKKEARNRGIEWEFNVHEWWRVWSESGRWDKRGTKDGYYVMARYGDTGPYAAWNVRIATHNENMAEAQVTRRLKSVADRNT